jgi:hypothetical protein
MNLGTSSKKLDKAEINITKIIELYDLLIDKMLDRYKKST